MLRARKPIVAACILLFLILIFQGGEQNVVAQALPRKTTVVVSFTGYEWWMINWEDNQIVCTVVVDHEGLPTVEEVTSTCGSTLAQTWVNTKTCDLGKGKTETSQCDGVYMHLASIQPAKKEVSIELPSPVVYVNLDGCTPTPPQNLCPTLPSLLFTGEEPLPNERITAIRGTYNGQPFYCEAATCTLPLQPTTLEGVTVEFWADSSFGDSSEHYTAQVRVIDSGVASSPGAGGWYVDVISSQWIGPPIATCASIWEAFPPVGTPPAWLSTPERSELMASGAPYYYLAGRLIAQGGVNASQCPNNGLLPNGYADACGLEKARSVLVEWQNQFDQTIINVALETGVPAQLMKNLFAQESQFWPGVFRVPFEFGLGQITDNGADSILLWNEPFYKKFCPTVLSEDTCAEGYLNLTSENKALLRGALASQANANCVDCPTGININNAKFSVSLFANTLVANCAQVNQTILTATDQIPGSISTYEDLWRLTLANYHAGAGCVSFAIHQAWQNTAKLNWPEVSSRFTEACRGVVPYVDKISGK